MTLWWRSSTSVRNEGLGSTENWHSTKVLKVNNEICNVWSASVKFSQTVHFLSQTPIFLFFNPASPKIQNPRLMLWVWKLELFVEQILTSGKLAWFCQTWCFYKTNKCWLCQTWCFYKTNKCWSSGNPPELIVFAFFNIMFFKKKQSYQAFPSFLPKN